MDPCLFLKVQVKYNEGIIYRLKHLFLSADGDCWLGVPHQKKQAGLKDLGNPHYGHQVGPKPSANVIKLFEAN